MWIKQFPNNNQELFLSSIAEYQSVSPTCVISDNLSLTFNKTNRQIKYSHHNRPTGHVFTLFCPLLSLIPMINVPVSITRLWHHLQDIPLNVSQSILIRLSNISLGVMRLLGILLRNLIHSSLPPSSLYVVDNNSISIHSGSVLNVVIILLVSSSSNGGQ